MPRLPLTFSHRSTLRPSRAFTIVDLIGTIAVLSVLGSVASMTVANALDSYIDASTRAQLHSELSIVVDRIDRELRKTLLKSGGTIAPEISSVAATSIVWNTDYSLTLSGTQLVFVEDGAASAVLLGDVSAFSIQVYNESNASIALPLSGAACNPIRRALLSITLQRSGVTETLRTKVFFRCTMEGA